MTNASFCYKLVKSLLLIGYQQMRHWLFSFVIEKKALWNGSQIYDSIMHGNNAKTYFGVFSWFFNGIWARIAGTSNRDSFAYQTRISNGIVVHVGLFLIWLYDNDNKRNTIHGCRREKNHKRKVRKWCTYNDVSEDNALASWEMKMDDGHDYVMRALPLLSISLRWWWWRLHGDHVTLMIT